MKKPSQPKTTLKLSSQTVRALSTVEMVQVDGAQRRNLTSTMDTCDTCGR